MRTDSPQRVPNQMSVLQLFAFSACEALLVRSWCCSFSTIIVGITPSYFQIAHACACCPHDS